MTPISLSAENRSPDETGWQEGFLRLCQDICGSQNGRFHEEESYYRGPWCPYCGNPVKTRKVTSHVDWRSCENCRRRTVGEILRLKELIRKTQENARHLFGLETGLELHAEKKSPEGISNTWRGNSKAADSSFSIHVKESRWRKPKHMAVLKGDLPDAIIAAEVIRYLCLMYLKQDLGESPAFEALADWFKVHYLFLIDRRDYAHRMDDQMQNGRNADGYQSWVQKLNSPLSARIVSMNHIKKIVQEEKTQGEPETAPEDIPQEESEAGGTGPEQDDREDVSSGETGEIPFE